MRLQNTMIRLKFQISTLFKIRMRPTKVCIECNLEKGLAEFYRNVLTEDGRTPKCKHCLDGEAIDRYVALLESDKKRREKNRLKKHST